MLRLIKIDFVRFCIVGATGLALNLVLLIMLPKLFGFTVPLAQLIGSEIALFSNFILHVNWTYKSKHVKKSILKLIVRFHATSWPAILGSVFKVSFSVDFLHLSKLLALLISSSIALLWNFGWTKFVIWKEVLSMNSTKIVE